MNCLNTRSGCREIPLTEPSAPPYYPQQPPYNPDFVYENIESEESFSHAYTWSTCNAELYAETAYEGDDESDRWGRRSLYEGVNCMPVSASARVHRAAR